MSTIAVTDSKVTLRVALLADYSDGDTEPLMTTTEILVMRDHPLLSALVDIWHLDEQTGKAWADNPMDVEALSILRYNLATLVELAFTSS